MTEQPRRGIRLRDFIHLLPVFVLLIIGSDISVPAGARAAMLKFSWAWLLYAVPVVSVLTYFALGFWLRRSIGAKAWFVSYFSAAILFAIPPLMLSLNTRSLSVAHYLQPAEMTALDANFSYPCFHYTSSGDGPTLVVRKSDYSEALMDYLHTNHLSVAK